MKFKNNFYENLIKTRPLYVSRNKEMLSNSNHERLNHIIKKLQEKGELSYKIHVKVGLKIKKNIKE